MWDKLGNLTNRYDDLQSLSETFAHDGLNRLTSSTVTGQTAKTYTYDDIGDLTKKSDVSASAYTYGTRATGCTQDPGPHAVSVASGQPFCYDANGNMTKGYNFRSSRARTYAWTTYNKPSRIVEGTATLTFSYGADRRRFKQVSSGRLTTVYVAGGLFEKRTRGTTATEVHHIQVQGRAVAVYTSLSSTTQSVRYLHGDHLGSVVLVTDEDGDVEGSRYSFDAFGRRRNGTNWTDTLTTLTNPDTTRGYTGHEMLDTVDIVHMNGRVYDPFLGRMLSPDPFVQAPFDMQSFNRYTYVFNNPLSLTDPSGFRADDGYYVFDSGWTVEVIYHPGPDGLGTFEVIRGIATRATWVPGSGNRGGGQAGGASGGGGNYGGGGHNDGGGGNGSGLSSEGSTGNPEMDTSTGSGWYRPEGHGYVVGRDGSWIPSGEQGPGIGSFLDDYFPAAHTFATHHDAFVGWAVDDLGAPDWLVNVPSMIPIYIMAFGQEANNSINSAFNVIFGMNLFPQYVHSHPPPSESNDE